MPAFEYTALTTQGKNQQGTVQADNPKAARLLIRQMDLVPLQVNIIKESQKHASFLQRFKRVTLQDLALLTRQLATLLAAGLPIEESLQGVSEQMDKPQVKSTLQGVRSGILEGHSLASSLRNFPQAFPELYCATVGAGEQTGRLDVILQRLADYTEKQQSMRQKIQQALIYPSMMTLVSIAIVGFLLVFVVPKIVNVFEGTGQSLPTLTTVLISISEGLQVYGIYLVILLIALFALMKHFLKKEPYLSYWHAFLLKIPMIGYAIKTINTARFARTFGILMAAGVGVLEAMRVSASLITNVQIQNATNIAAKKIKEGSAIHLALKQTAYFSPMMLHLISTGEASGRLEDMLERAADSQDNDVSRLLETGLTLFEPMIIIIMGIVVLFIVLAILLPIFELNQLV